MKNSAAGIKEKKKNVQTALTRFYINSTCMAETHTNGQFHSKQVTETTL